MSRADSPPSDTSAPTTDASRSRTLASGSDGAGGSEARTAFLLWSWLSNLALLFGAVLDTEVERARQLRAGIAAEERVQLPLRDDRLLETNREQRARDFRASAAMRPPTAVDGLVTSADLPARDD